MTQARAFRVRSTLSIPVVITLAMIVALLATLLVSTPRARAEAPWTDAGSMSVPRVGHTASRLPNGKVLVVGGSEFGDGGYVYHRSTEVYDQATNSWRTGASMALPRTGHTATTLPDGRILVAGGMTFDGEISSVLTTAEIFDPATQNWSYVGDLNVARTDHTATLLNNGFVLFAGGQTMDEFGMVSNLSSAEIFSVDTGFASVPDMAVAHMDHTATLLQDGSVLVVGGLNAANQVQTVAERYVFGTGWSAAGDLSFARSKATAHLLPNGEVIVAGGYDGTFSGSDTATTEYYTPDTGWRIGAPLSGSRFDHTMTMLAYGQLFVVGGYTYDGDQYRGSVTVGGVDGFGFSEYTTTLAYPRAGHVAVLLNDGTVLVVGGFGSSGELASAERWKHSYYTPELSAPTYQIKTGALGAAGVMVNVSWTVTGSNYDSMHHFDAELRTNSSAWQPISLSEPAPLSIDMPFQPGARYQVRVRAIDRVGGIGPWATGVVFTLRGAQESASSIAYTAGWQVQKIVGAWGGAVKHQRLAYARATFSFDGSRVAIVTTKGPNRGKAQILVDGVFVKSIDLYASTIRPATIITIANDLADGPHTVQVKVLGTKNAASTGTRVDVDGFVVID